MIYSIYKNYFYFFFFVSIGFLIKTYVLQFLSKISSFSDFDIPSSNPIVRLWWYPGYKFGLNWYDVFVINFPEDLANFLISHKSYGFPLFNNINRIKRLVNVIKFFFTFYLLLYIILIKINYIA